MTKLVIATVCGLTVLASACTKTGSSGSERNKTTDTSATATTQPGDTTQPAAPVPQPDPVLPDVPTPPPTGWKEYDSYFESLLKVHALVIDTTKEMPGSTLKELQTRAAALAKDASKEHEQSARVRQQLSDQVKMFVSGPGMEKSNDHVMEAFRPILMTSRDVLQMPGGEVTHGHSDKVNVMMIELDRALIHARSLNR